MLFQDKMRWSAIGVAAFSETPADIWQTFREVQELERATILSAADVEQVRGMSLSKGMKGHVSVLDDATLSHIVQHGLLLLARDNEGNLLGYHHGVLPPCDYTFLRHFDPDDIIAYPGHEQAVAEMKQSRSRPWTVWRTTVHPDLQGLGTGLALALKYLGLKVALAHGCAGVTCNVAEFNNVSWSMNDGSEIVRAGWRTTLGRFRLHDLTFSVRWEVHIGNIATALAAIGTKLASGGWCLMRLDRFAESVTNGAKGEKADALSHV